MKETAITYGFEKLDVWHRAVAFAGDIYRITRGFPKEEVFGLTSQLRRAGVSVAANIAEGNSRSSKKEQLRFLEIAYGSLNEIATLAYIAAGQQFITEEQLGFMKSEVSGIGKMLSGLKKFMTVEGKNP